MSNLSLTTESYNHWYTRIYGYFYRRLNTVTEVRELTVDTLADFFTYSKAIEDPKALIFKIAENKLKSYLRSKAKQPLVEDIEDTKLKTKLSYSGHYYYRTEILIDCARQSLKPKHFEVVELCVLCDFSSQRAAAELNLKPDNVRQILRRSLKKLREKCRQIWLSMN